MNLLMGLGKSHSLPISCYGGFHEGDRYTRA
jgi:hypothetical protein